MYAKATTAERAVVPVLRSTRRHPLQPVPRFLGRCGVPGLGLPGDRRRASASARRRCWRRCGRAAGIPSRVGFADVKNHLTTPAAARAHGLATCSSTTVTPSSTWRGSGSRRLPAFNRRTVRAFPRQTAGVRRPRRFQSSTPSMPTSAATWSMCATAAATPTCRSRKSPSAFREAYPVLYALRGDAAGETFRLTPRDLLEASFRAAVAAADPLEIIPRHLPKPAGSRPHPDPRRRQGGRLDGACRGAPLAGGQAPVRHRPHPLRACNDARAGARVRGGAPGAGCRRRGTLRGKC